MKIKPKHPQLRTDIPVMKEDEINSWVEEILGNTHAIDVKVLHNKLTEAIEEDHNALIFSRTWHMCDKCEITYPEHITWCKCGNDKLRSFKIYDNLDEVLKNKK